jgi:hypothetical protein
MINFENTFDLISNKNLRKELKLCDETIDKLTKKCEILEENNELLIQQKYQMYEDLDFAYKKIDKAIEYIRSNEWAKDYEISNCRTHLLEILGDKENE